jgi:hypothetical protein
MEHATPQRGRTVIIPARFNGPPDTGNGGYTSGLLAAHVHSGLAGAGAAVEVTLFRPPPLDTELVVRAGAAGTDATDRIGAYHGEVLIAEAIPTTLHSGETVPPVSYAEAVTAAAAYPGLVSHPFPGCFVCGPDRAPGDGLRLFPGRLGDGRTAAPFVVPAGMSPELVWAALDCPGGWTVPLETRSYVLGRMATRIDAVPAPGQECVVTGALIDRQGRLASVLSSLYGPDGRLLATARATWIAIATLSST